jgi:hypothetical protein
VFLLFSHLLPTNPQASLKPLFGLSKGPTGVFKSVLDTNRTDGKRRDEIYVDVVERLAVTFNAAGHAISSQTDGSIQVRVCGVSVGADAACRTNQPRSVCKRGS